MMVVLQDDDCLYCYDSPEAVAAQIEGLDAEDCLRRVYDQSGRRYRIAWIKPNQNGWAGCVNGVYRLVPTAVVEPTALLELLLTKRAFGRDEQLAALAEGLRLGTRR
jgi:hypothetical protein